MAGLSIGQLNLQLVGDAKGLKRMLPDMNRLGKSIDKLNKKAEAGSSRTVASLNKQEQAIRRQIVAGKKLNAQQKRGGQSPAQLGRNTAALQAFIRTMSKGALTTTQFNRAQDRLNGTLARSSRSFKKVQTAAGKGKIGKMANAMRNLESASVLAVGPLSGIGARIRALGAIANRSALSLVLMFGAITGGVVILFKLVKGALDSAKAMEALMSRLIFVTGSIKLARSEFAFIEKVASSMGLSVEKSALAYSSLAAATKGMKNPLKIARSLFKGLSAAAATLRLTGEQVEGAFRAVEQIASKGKLTSEELVQQLAERIPGAIQIMADALEVEKEALIDLMANGLVPAEEALSKFGAQLQKEFGAGASKNLESLVGSMNRLNNATFAFSRNFDELFGISQKSIGALNALASIVEHLARNMDTYVKITGAAIGAMVGMFASNIIAGFVLLTVSLVKATAAMKTFSIFTLASSRGMKGLAKFILTAAAFATSWILVEKLIGDVSDAFEDLGVETDKLNASWTKLQKSIFKDMQETLKDLDIEFKVLQGGLGLTSKAALTAAAKLGFLDKALFSLKLSVSDIDPAFIRMFDEMDRAQKNIDGFTRLKEILKETETKAEGVARAFEEIDDLRTLLSSKAGNFLSVSEMDTFILALDRLEKGIGKNKKIAFEFGDAFGSAFEDAIIQAKSLRKVLQGLLQDIIKIIIRQTITKPIGEFISASLISGFAGGGKTPSGNEPFMVGEKGPELLSFSKSGTVTSNDELARIGNSNASTGRTVIVHQSNSFSSDIKDDVRAMIIEATPAIAQASAEALVDHTKRVGFTRVFGGI